MDWLIYNFSFRVKFVLLIDIIIMPFRNAFAFHPVDFTTQKSLVHLGLHIIPHVMHSGHVVFDFCLVISFVCDKRKSQIIWRSSIFRVLIKQKVATVNRKHPLIRIYHKSECHVGRSARLTDNAQWYSSTVFQVKHVEDVSMHQRPVSLHPCKVPVCITIIVNLVMGSYRSCGLWTRPFWCCILGYRFW